MLYDMTPADEATLDQWEGSEFGMHKKIRCRVERLSSDTTTDPALAWLYVMDAYEGGRRRRATWASWPMPRRSPARPAITCIDPDPSGPQHRSGSRQ